MLCVSIAYGNGGGLSSYLGGVKASTPAARSLLDPRLRSRRSCPQVGAEEWSFSLTKEYFRKDAFGTFGEGAARGPIKFRDQKPLKTPRFACPGSIGTEGGHEVKLIAPEAVRPFVKSLVRRICGRRPAPAVYQVHDTRR